MIGSDQHSDCDADPSRDAGPGEGISGIGNDPVQRRIKTRHVDIDRHCEPFDRRDSRAAQSYLRRPGWIPVRDCHLDRRLRS